MGKDQTEDRREGGMKGVRGKKEEREHNQVLSNVAPAKYNATTESLIHSQVIYCPA